LKSSLRRRPSSSLGSAFIAASTALPSSVAPNTITSVSTFANPLTVTIRAASGRSQYPGWV
jgi:hypothetical protein